MSKYITENLLNERIEGSDMMMDDDIPSDESDSAEFHSALEHLETSPPSTSVSLVSQSSAAVVSDSSGFLPPDTASTSTGEFCEVTNFSNTYTTLSSQWNSQFSEHELIAQELPGTVSSGPHALDRTSLSPLFSHTSDTASVALIEDRITDSPHVVSETQATENEIRKNLDTSNKQIGMKEHVGFQGQCYQGQCGQGQFYQGQPGQGQFYQGQCGQGQFYQGQPGQGQFYQGQCGQGQFYQGQCGQGQFYQGQPGQGQCYQGQCGQGQFYQGQPGQGQFYQGQCGQVQFYQGQPGQGQFYQGQCGQGQFYQGQCGQGQFYQGQPGQGQCYQGQCGQGQFYQGQPGQGQIGQGPLSITQLCELKTQEASALKKMSSPQGIAKCPQRDRGQQRQRQTQSQPDSMCHDSQDQQKQQGLQKQKSEVCGSVHSLKPVSGSASCHGSDNRTVGSRPSIRPKPEHVAAEAVDICHDQQPAHGRGSTTVEVRGLWKQSKKDTVECYFENPIRSSGGKIQHLRWNKTTGLCLLTFKSAKVAQQVASREHLLDGKKLAVKMFESQSRATNLAEMKAVCVENFDLPTTTEDALRDHFENPRHSGGEVIDVKIESHRESVPMAIVTFRRAEDAQRALSQEHELNRRQLSVTPHNPPPAQANMVSVHNLEPTLLAEDVLHFVESHTECLVYDVLMGQVPAVALVIFDCVVDFTAVQSALTSTRLMEKQLRVEPVPETRTVEVHNLPQTPSLCPETLTCYFRNTARSGGRDVTEVQFLPGRQTALVTFDSPEVCSAVASQRHMFHGSELEVRPHFQCVGLCGNSPQPAPGYPPPPEPEPEAEDLTPARQFPSA